MNHTTKLSDADEYKLKLAKAATEALKRNEQARLEREARTFHLNDLQDRLRPLDDAIGLVHTAS